MTLLWPLATALSRLARYVVVRSPVVQVCEDAMGPAAAPGQINQKLRDGTPVWVIPMTVRTVMPVSPWSGLVGKDDQIVVFDEDLASEVDAGSPDTSQLAVGRGFL